MINVIAVFTMILLRCMCCLHRYEFFWG